MKRDKTRCQHGRERGVRCPTPSHCKVHIDIHPFCHSSTLHSPDQPQQHQCPPGSPSPGPSEGVGTNLAVWQPEGGTGMAGHGQEAGRSLLM